jgi:HD-GYP domain-containing protein (c-di-GMP phosphodiesterase class II)
MSFEEAIEELKACSGTQFDPEITQIFIELLLDLHSCRTKNMCKDKTIEKYAVQMSL